MKFKDHFFIFVLLIILSACSNVQVIKTGSDTTINLPPIEPSSIIIFRSASPEWKYQEIGTITVKTIGRIDIIYKKMREEAAKRGADAVIDFKLESDIRSIPTTYIINGTTYYVMETVISIISSGTLIRRKLEL